MIKAINKFLILILLSILTLSTSFILISRSENYHHRKTIVNLEKYTMITDLLEILKENNHFFEEVNLYVINEDNKVEMVFTSAEYKSLFNFNNKILLLASENTKIDMKPLYFENCVTFSNENKERCFWCHIGELDTKKIVIEIKVKNNFEPFNNEEREKSEKIILKILENLKIIFHEQ